jgi:type IV fimbrial biogenesis protein FimT
MLFDPVRGTTSPAGTVRVVSDAGSIHHVVNIMGRARSCSPDGAVKGYKAC